MACSGSPSREDASVLDQILKNTEYENSQQVKAIEGEQERIEVYQRQAEERMKQIHDLEESTLSLDDHAKRLHKQFRLNRENYESLKRTSSVLDEHEEALKRKLEAAQQSVKQQSAEHEEALSKYEGIWSSYQAKYDSFERAQELQTKQKELELLESQNDGLERQINELETSVSHLQIQNGEESTLVAWVLQIAALRVETVNTLEAMTLNQRNAAQLEKENAELQKKIIEAQEVLKQQEIQRKNESEMRVSGRDDTAPPPPQLHDTDFSFGMLHTQATSNATQTLPSLKSATMTAPTARNQPPSYQQGTNNTINVQPQPVAVNRRNPASSQQTSHQTQNNRFINTFTLPQLPQRPSIATSKILTGTEPPSAGLTAHSIRQHPLQVLPSSAGVKEKTTIQPKTTSVTASKYMLEIPQLSTPRASATNSESVSFSKNPATSQKTQPLQGGGRSDNSTSSVASRRPPSRPPLPQLQIPMLQTPSRPRPSPAVQENTLQLPPKSSSQLILPTLPAQAPKPPQSSLAKPTSATSNMLCRTIAPPEGNTITTSGKEMQADNSHAPSLEVMDMHEPKSENTVPQSATSGSTASTNDDQSKEAEQPGQQHRPDLQLQENGDQVSGLDASYSVMYNPDDSISADGYMYYGEYEGEMVSQEFADGQMMAHVAMQPQESAAGFFPGADQSAGSQSDMFYGGFGTERTMSAFGGDFSSGFGFSTPKVSGSSTAGMGFGFGFGGGSTPTAPQQNNQGFAFSFGGGGSSSSQKQFSFF